MANGIGRTKGGRNTKLHAICDDKGRPPKHIDDFANRDIAMALPR